MGPTPFYGARAENPPFAKKQTNICPAAAVRQCKQNLLDIQQLGQVKADKDKVGHGNIYIPQGLLVAEC